MIASSATDRIAAQDEAFIARRPDGTGWMLISHDQAIRGTLTTGAGPHLEGIMQARHDGLATIRRTDGGLELRYEGKAVGWDTDAGLLRNSTTAAPMLTCIGVHDFIGLMVGLRPVRHIRFIACPTGCARINRVVLDPLLGDRGPSASRKDRWRHRIHERMLAFLHGRSAEVWLPDLYDREEADGHVHLSLDGKPVKLTMRRSSGPVTTLYVQEPGRSAIPITGMPSASI